jgi:hypothetical protein
MGRSQDQKGQRGERSAAESLRNHYFACDAARAPRKDRGDIEGGSVVGVGAHVEVKSYAKHAVYKFMEQAVAQKGDDQWPLLILKANNKKNHLYVIRDVDILDFVRGYLTNRARLWKLEPTSEIETQSSTVSRVSPSGEVSLTSSSSPKHPAQPFEESPLSASSSATWTRSTGKTESSVTQPGLEAASSSPDARAEASSPSTGTSESTERTSRAS